MCKDIVDPACVAQRGIASCLTARISVPEGAANGGQAAGTPAALQAVQVVQKGGGGGGNKLAAVLGGVLALAGVLVISAIGFVVYRRKHGGRKGRKGRKSGKVGPMGSDNTLLRCVCAWGGGGSNAWA